MLAKDFIKLAKAIPSDHYFDPIFNGDGDGLSTLTFCGNKSVTFVFGNHIVYTLSEVIACIEDTPNAELINADCLVHQESEGDGCWFDVQSH